MRPTLRAVMLGDCNDLLDADGRPLGEIRASSATRQAVPTHYAMCPYAGSRRRSPRMLNLSALEQLTSAWPQPLEILDASRQLHGIQPGVRPPLLELCRICFTVLCLPAYLAYQAQPRAVAPEIAASHKMAQGLFGLCKNLLIERIQAGENFQETIAEMGELYHFAEDNGALLSRTGIEACAASPSMIGQALRVLTEGVRTRHVPASPLMAIWEDVQDALREYSVSVANTHLWITVTAIALRTAMDRLIQCSTAKPSLDWLLTDPSDYPQTGFNDPVVSNVLNMPDEIRIQYARGAASLCAERDVRVKLHRVLDCATGRRTEGVPSTAGAAAFWAENARAVEHDAVQLFDHLQQRIHGALHQPDLAKGALNCALTQTFGRLPRHWLG